MATAAAPLNLLAAAVFSDLVYHTNNEAIEPPPGWQFIGYTYDVGTSTNTGFYAEAWGLPNGSGGFSQIVIANRGTVFSEPGIDPELPSGQQALLENNYQQGNDDNGKTITDDLEIIGGIKPTYISLAAQFLTQIAQANPGVPIIETGQSLGGATAAGALADVFASNPGLAANVTADTFNALPYGENITSLTGSGLDTVDGNITNFYVGNEFLTQTILGRIFQYLTGGPPLGSSQELPSLPDDITGEVGDQNIIKIHDAPAGVSQLFQYLYPNSSTSGYAAAIALLEKAYPNYQNSNTNSDSGQPFTPSQIYDLLAGIAVPSDDESQAVRPNLNNTVSFLTGGDGSLADAEPSDAQQIETVSLDQAAANDTYQVVSVAPSAANHEQAVWETDAYNSTSQLVGITQSKVYTDGSFSVYTYSPTRVLQSIYSAESTGDTLEQTYSNTGDLNTSVDLTPNNTLEVDQYQDDPTLISDSTIDIGTAVVTEIIQDSDQSVLTELNYGTTSNSSGTNVGMVANADGSAEIVDGQGEHGTSGSIINFGTAGLSDDTLDITQSPSGTIDVTIEIEPGAVTDIASDQDLADTQEDFAFTGTNEILRIGTISAFSGIISNFASGDTIDLAGISATGATLGANNVLTVQESSGVITTLQLDPTQNFGGISFSVGPDGSGGSDIANIATPGELVGVNGGMIEVVNPVNGAVTQIGSSIAGFQGVQLGAEAAQNGTLYFEAGVSNQRLLYAVDVKSGQVLSSVTSGAVNFVVDNLTGELVGVNGGMIEVVNPVNGAVTQIGSSIAGFQGVQLGAEAAQNGTLYFEAGVSNQRLLYAVDAKSGEVLSSVDSNAVNFVADNLTGELVGVNGGMIEVVNPVNGAVTQIGSSIAGFQGVQLGAEAAQNGTLYFEAGVSNQRLLYAVDVKSGQVLSSVTSGAVNFVVDQSGTPLCFLPGTQIATPSGQIPIEQLAVGDEVTTLRGEARRTVWIGNGRVLAPRGRRNAATPVIVRKNALADNVPHHDLRVTKAHGIYVDNVLIPVEFLINHRSILWDDHAQEVKLYHIELETHDVLLANGAPAESYRDDGNRWLFGNANSGWGLPPQEPCAPVLTGGPVVDAAWRRLLNRAGPRPGFPLTDDPDLHLMVDERRVNAASLNGVSHIFRLAARPATMRIVSRTGVPQELGLARDPRSLGVALRQIVVNHGMGSQTVKAEDARLTDGFHQFEADNEIRWTDGDATVPEDLFGGFAGPLEVVLHLGGMTGYVDHGIRIEHVA